MGCPGLHCPGCSSGQSLGILAAAAAAVVVAYETVQWVADRIWWIGSTVAVCFALAVAASMWLEQRSDRRAAEWGAARGIRSRADVILPYPVRVAEVPAEPRRELDAPALHLHFHGLPDAEQVHVIRQALGRN